MQRNDFIPGEFYKTYGGHKVKLVASSYNGSADCHFMVFLLPNGSMYLTTGIGKKIISSITHYDNGVSIGFGDKVNYHIDKLSFDQFDIRSKWVEPTTVSGWVCVYDTGRIGTTMYPTLEEAMRNKNSHIVDRVYVEGKSK